MEQSKDGLHPPADPQAFLSDLVESVGRTLPADVLARVLSVDRKRTLRDLLTGRPGEIRRIRLIEPNETLTLGYERGPAWTGETAQMYGGVIIARSTIGLGELLTAFAGRVAALAADAAGDCGRVVARAADAGSRTSRVGGPGEAKPRSKVICAPCPLDWGVGCRLRRSRRSGVSPNSSIDTLAG